MRYCLLDMMDCHTHTSNRSSHGYLNKSKSVKKNSHPYGWEGSTKATPLAEELLEVDGPWKGRVIFL